ncbi:MAG: lipid-A-disaccharide synthase N-terminal domain-containing protein, partial [Pseudomonadota bacterium]
MTLGELAAHFGIETTQDAIWFGVGVTAQLAFTMRFLIQWIASEKAGRSIVPVAFWYFSLAGGIVLFIYGVREGEAVILLGQSFGIIVYLRNIWLIHAEQRRERERLSVSLPPQPLSAVGAAADDRRWATTALAAIIGVTILRLITLSLQSYPLLGDEAQYWTWAQALDWGYYSKPPMVAWAIAGAEAVCGDHVACFRAPATLSYAVGATFVFLLGARLFGARIGAWAAVVYATLPGVSFSALLVTTDPFLLMFWAIGLYAVHRAATAPPARLWWAIVGVAVGFGLLSKYAMIAFPFSLLLWALVDPAARAAMRPAGLVIAAAIAAAIFAPNLLWNAAQDWPTLAHTGDNVNLDGGLFNPENLLKFFGEQFGVFGPLLMAALIALL